MTGFSRIFRTLVDAFPSSGAGPVAQPSSLSDEVSLVHEISHIFARADERRIVQTVGGVGVNVVNLNNGFPAPVGRYHYVLGASAFHNDVAPRLLEFYAFDTGGSALAYQLRSSRDFVPAGHAANEIFGLARPIIILPGFFVRVFCPGIGALATITGDISFIECPFQDLATGP
jgi:hypothetical protein